jgi:hypothetical protein
MKFFGFLCALMVSATSASCFSVDVAGLQFNCDPTQTGNCPDGEVCSAASKTCVPTGTGTTQVDMATSSTAPMLVPAPGCPSGMGYDLSKGTGMAFACPAVYSNKNGMTADAQCKAGFMICTKTDSIDLAKCNMIKDDFFIANVPSHKYPTQNAACGAAQNAFGQMWEGCGGKQGTTNLSCMGFGAALPCGQAGSSFTCADNGIGDVINTDANSGVLCCH